MAATKPDIITPTVMAIREVLMEYYKSSCVERLTTSSDVYLSELPSERRRGRTYNYEQWEAQQHNKRLLSLSGVPLFTLQHNPEEMTMHMLSLNRSKQLQAVRAGVEEFMVKYLSGVQIKRNNTSYVGHRITITPTKKLKDDSKLMKAQVKDVGNNPLQGMEHIVRRTPDGIVAIDVGGSWQVIGRNLSDEAIAQYLRNYMRIDIPDSLRGTPSTAAQSTTTWTMDYTTSFTDWIG